MIKLLFIYILILLSSITLFGRSDKAEVAEVKKLIEEAAYFYGNVSKDTANILLDRIYLRVKNTNKFEPWYKINTIIFLTMYKQDQNKYEDALKYLLYADTIAHENGLLNQDAYYLKIIKSIGICYYKLNEPLLAIDYLKRVESNLTHSRTNDSLAFDNDYILLRIYFDIKDYTTSKEYCESALQYFQKNPAYYKVYINECNKYLAEICYFTGDIKKSLTLTNSILMGINQNDDPWVYHKWNTLRLKLLVCNGAKIEEKLISYKQYLNDKYNEYDSKNIDISSLMAQYYDRNGDKNKAIDYWKQTIFTIKNFLTNYLKFFNDEQKAFYTNQLEEHVQLFASFVARNSDNKALLELLYEYVLSTKAIIFDLSKDLYSNAVESNDQQIVNLYNEFKLSRGLLAGELSNNNNSNTKSQTELKRKIDSLEKELAEICNIEKRYTDNVQLSWKIIKYSLKPDEAAVEIIRVGDKTNCSENQNVNYLAMIITGNKDDIELKTLNFTNNTEDDIVTEYLNLLKDVTASQTGSSLSINQNITKALLKKMYGQFWEKIGNGLGNIRNVYLSLDGVYNKINLNTLIDPQGKYLIDNYNFTLIPSTRDIIKQDWKRNTTKTAVLVGDVKYDLDKADILNFKPNGKDVSFRSPISLNSSDSTLRIGLTPLPYTKEEIKSIKHILLGQGWQVKDLVQTEANETTIKRLKNPAVLHIATHGGYTGEKDKYNPSIMKSGNITDNNPLFGSYLALAGAKNTMMRDNNFKAADDGFLTAYEALNMDLTKTQLVVLSACQTGLGRIRNGEGVYGLQRAFMIAGTRYLIMSLWQVDDKITNELMTTFYENWIDKAMDIKEAFKSAQMTIKSKNPNFFFWGSFVLVGK